MANEKIFVGELGAKEMYRRLKGIIPSAWKDWSEQHDSVGTDGAIYIGQNNDLNRTWSFGFGNYNTASSTILADWSGSDVVMVGSYNNAIDAAGAYQIGFHNTVRNNHRMLIDAPTYNYYTAINFGNGNEIDAEGVNIGKHNTANHFSVNIGQHNSGEHAAVAIGEHNTANKSSAAIGKNAIAKANSIAIGNGNVVSGVKVVNGEVTNEEWGSSIAVGLWNLYAGGGSMAIGFGSSTAGKYSSVTEGAIGILLDNIGSASYQSDIKTGAIVVGQNIKAANNSLSFGRNNTVDGDSLTFGSNNSAYGNSISIGYSNSIDYYNAKYDLYDGKSIAIGFGQSEIYSSGFAIGHSNTTIYGSGMCFGIRNIGVYSTAVAIGADNKNIYGDAYAIGAQNENITGNAVAIGRKNTNVSSAAAVVGSYNSANQGSFVIGYSNTVSLGSSAIGVANSGTGGVYLIGVGNTATASESDTLSADFHGNAAILGFGNTLKNIRAVWHSGDMSYGETKHTFSFVSGSYINAYGHNLIAIGHGHIVGDPTTWMTDSETNTKNDGFMTAIGYKCNALRNFDFAFGYKSMAKGGENVAIQHSTAIGYRNVAMVDSTVDSGIANFALCESSLNITNSYKPYNKTQHNLLFNSLVSAEKNVAENLIFNTKATVSVVGNGFNRNIINVGTHNHTLAIGSTNNYGSIVNNIIIGAKNARFFTPWDDNDPISLTADKINRNTLLNNAYKASSFYNFVDNIISNSELNVTDRSSCIDNIVLHSGLVATHTSGSELIGNVLLSRSKIFMPDKRASILYNLLVNSALGMNTGTPDTTDADMSRNVLVNTFASNADSCFSMTFGGAGRSYQNSDGMDLGYFNRSNYSEFSETNGNSVLADCNRVFNFGDNICISVANSTIFGVNKVTDIDHSFISGRGNIVTGIVGYYYKTPTVNILGVRNTVTNLANDYIGGTNFFGNSNTALLGNKCGENTVIGSLNYIAEPIDIQKLTPSQVLETLSTRGYYQVTDPCIMPDGEDTNTLTYMNTFYYYVMYNNRVAYITDSDSIFASITPVVTTPATFQSMYTAGTLQPGVYYKVSSGGDVNIPSGKLLLPGVTYDIGPYDSSSNHKYSIDYTLQDVFNGGVYGTTPVTYSSRNTIIGSVNNISSRIVDYAVIGSQNLVKCNTGFKSASDPYAISNGFVQGNNNTVQNGSNIICMGNGNVSTGHNSVAIGSQLISNQWQTVIGKYNVAIAGPNRLSTQTPQDPTKALFIVGNGYSSDDSLNWQNETYITRSNALELYADGRLKVSGNIEAANIPAAPAENGQYTLNCTVNDGTVTYNWVQVE